MLASKVRKEIVSVILSTSVCSIRPCSPQKLTVLRRAHVCQAHPVGQVSWALWMLPHPVHIDACHTYSEEVAKLSLVASSMPEQRCEQRKVTGMAV